MNDVSKTNVATAVQFLQLFVLIIGVAGIFSHIGSRDNQLDTNTKDIAEIKGIAQDLLMAQITSASNDARLSEALDGLRDRINLLEKP